MTVGMSPPPMGRISSTPNSSDKPVKVGKTHGGVGSTIIQTPSATANASSAMFTKFWP